MNRDINLKDAHNQALKGIVGHARIGRIPCYDYMIEYFECIQERLPPCPIELDHFLNESETIVSSNTVRDLVESTYRKYALDIPIGLLDLPVWWAKAIMASIESVNWVEPDLAFTEAAFGWSMVHLQGAYLDIQMESPVEANDEWYLIGDALVNLHRRLEPGPLTPAARFVEFF